VELLVLFFVSVLGVDVVVAGVGVGLSEPLRFAALMPATIKMMINIEITIIIKAVHPDDLDFLSCSWLFI
jgi:hypothetical protein